MFLILTNRYLIINYISNFQGFDTTASTLSTVLLMLGLHQYVQDKVVEELSLLFDTQDQEVDQEKLNQMPYIEMVIKETMRLFPILPATGRTATADVQLG